MKRKLFSLILCLLLLGSALLSASAATTAIQDYANLMSSTQREALTQKANTLGQDYGLDVVILTVPNLMGKSAQDFADDFYDNNRYGADGVLFLVDMGSRQWHISTSGTAIEALEDWELEDLGNEVIPYLSDGEFYEGFSWYLDILPIYLEDDVGTGFILLTALFAGAVIAGIIVLIMRASMNTRRPQHSAENYMTEGSYHLNVQQDLFLYSNVTKRPRPRNNSSGSSMHRSSGSSVHRSSSGTRHGGRGGHF